MMDRTADGAACLVPAVFDPDQGERIERALKRLIGAAEWLQREIEEERGCHAALQQVSVIQTELDSVAVGLLQAHLRFCLTRALEAGATPDEVRSLLAPLGSLLRSRQGA